MVKKSELEEMQYQKDSGLEFGELGVQNQKVGFRSEDYSQLSGSLRSADLTLNEVVNLHQIVTLLDVGCGNGAWLSAAQSKGIEKVVGVEGGEITGTSLLIDEDFVHRLDVSQPFDLGQEFDLVMSLEVAEHVSENSATEFIRNLCRHGNAVLFSAAIPGQEGTGHVNCQWPEYWSEKFAMEGYECFDFLRNRIWMNQDIEVWYRQNLLFFAKGPVRDEIVKLGHNPSVPQRLVHPDLWEWTASELSRLKSSGSVGRER